MIALSRPFTLRHPWWSVVFLTLLGVLFILLALLPVWGWVEVSSSPVQRFYLPVYLQSTVGVLQGCGPEYVEWIEKRAPGKAWEITDPGDPVPVKEGTAPFELSKSALSQGWTELGYTEGGTFQQKETRDYMEANFRRAQSFVPRPAAVRAGPGRVDVLEVLRQLAKESCTGTRCALGPAVRSAYPRPGP